MGNRHVCPLELGSIASELELFMAGCHDTITADQ